MDDSPANFAGHSRSSVNPRSLRTPWPSRRHTPYTKTPRTGRVSRTLDKSIDKFGSKASNTKSKDSRSQKLGPVTHIDSGIRLSKGKQTSIYSKSRAPSSRLFEAQSVVNKTWRVYCLSPFFNFEYEERAFKKYGRLLSAHLEAESQREMFVEVGVSNQTLRANFTVVKGITLSESDFDSVEITIKTTTAGRSKITDSPILVALFCSVGRKDNENADPILKTNFTSLPVCLVKGPAVLARSLVAWFETQFDCRMTFMAFSPAELGWFAALWASVVPPGHSKPVELCYSLPSSVKGLSRITVDIEPKDARHLWRCVHNSDSDIFTEPEAQVFLKAIEVHFYHHFKIDLSAIPLTRVGTSVAFVGSEGRLKILHPDYVQHVLQQVMQTAVTRELMGRL